MEDKVSLRAKLDSFTEHWVPKVVAELNGQYVKVAKFQGAFGILVGCLVVSSLYAEQESLPRQQEHLILQVAALACQDDHAFQ